MTNEELFRRIDVLEDSLPFDDVYDQHDKDGNEVWIDCHELLWEVKERIEHSFTREELEGWLYENILNNVGINDAFAGHVDEICNRLDGFERYCEDKRNEQTGKH